MIRAGRGWGKTRTGSEWVHKRAMARPGRWIAFIARTPADARDYMVEGPGGVLANAPPWERPDYEPSKRRLTWPNGSWATIYSDQKPDQLRGFSGDTAWVDELGKYDHPYDTWDNLRFGMREASDDHPRIVITTTPRPLELFNRIEAMSTCRLTIGSSYENRSNLDPTWFSEVLSSYEGTRLGRQEIHAELLEDLEGRVYTNFSKKRWPIGNLDDTVEDLGGELLVGQDFNVDPMASVIAQRVADECHVLDCISLPSSNTQELAQELNRRYPKRSIVMHPDPSGRARRTSAPVGQTDFTILEKAGFRVNAAKTAPPVVDRINSVQAMLQKGDLRRLRIHPRAEAVIASLGGLCYKEGTRIIDKSSGLDHHADALGYLIWNEFNLVSHVGEAKPFDPDFY